jgi:hypothetical protein
MGNKALVSELIGWYGAIAILLAYALVSFGTIPSSGYVYQFLNLTGAIGIVYISIVKNDNQPAALNIVWAIIAIVAIIGLINSGQSPI